MLQLMLLLHCESNKLHHFIFAIALSHQISAVFYNCDPCSRTYNTML